MVPPDSVRTGVREASHRPGRYAINLNSKNQSVFVRSGAADTGSLERCTVRPPGTRWVCCQPTTGPSSVLGPAIAADRPLAHDGLRPGLRRRDGRRPGLQRPNPVPGLREEPAHVFQRVQVRGGRPGRVLDILVDAELLEALPQRGEFNAARVRVQGTQDRRESGVLCGRFRRKILDGDRTPARRLLGTAGRPLVLERVQNRAPVLRATAGTAPLELRLGFREIILDDVAQAPGPAHEGDEVVVGLRAAAEDFDNPRRDAGHLTIVPEDQRKVKTLLGLFAPRKSAWSVYSRLAPPSKS